MNIFADNFLKVERALSEEKGPFSLVALFLREDAPEKWDLVISAPWIESDKEAALKLISAKVRELLNPPELLAVSRIVLVEPTSPAVDAINRAFHVEHSVIEIHDSTFFGLAIKHAYIFASARVEVAIPPKGSPAKSLQRTRRKAVRR